MMIHLEVSEKDTRKPYRIQTYSRSIKLRKGNHLRYSCLIPMRAGRLAYAVGSISFHQSKDPQNKLRGILDDREDWLDPRVSADGGPNRSSLAKVEATVFAPAILGLRPSRA